MANALLSRSKGAVTDALERATAAMQVSKAEEGASADANAEGSTSKSESIFPILSEVVRELKCLLSSRPS